MRQGFSSYQREKTAQGRSIRYRQFPDHQSAPKAWPIMPADAYIGLSGDVVRTIDHIPYLTPSPSCSIFWRYLVTLPVGPFRDLAVAPTKTRSSTVKCAYRLEHLGQHLFDRVNLALIYRALLARVIQ